MRTTVLCAIGSFIAVVWVQYLLIAPVSQEQVMKPSEEGVKMYVEEFVSDALTIDKVYGSMVGPMDKFLMKLPSNGDPELVWIKNIAFIALDNKGNEQPDGQFLCHGQLFYNDMEEFTEINDERFSRGRSLPRKLFTGIQGQLDLPMPEGFGIPIYTDEEFEVVTMAFNLDPDLDTFDMRIKAQLSYVRDSETTVPMRALGKSAIDITLPLSEAAYEGTTHTACGVTLDDQLQVGTHATEKANLRNLGNGFMGTNHFLVAPGRHEYKYQLVGSAIIPFDTKVHMMTGHMHPYGEFVELKDLTTGEVVFVSNAKNHPEYLFVEDMTSYTSVEGMTIYRDHEYEYRAVYNNTSGDDIDAMAVMYFYYDDKEFNREIL